jgi:glycine/D-amino acid oxidase-like deaminating enzyme
MSKNYDFAVIGAGVFGGWTAYRLRLGGFSVAVVDAYGPANSRASSGGETRVIRMGYGPDELYTRWSQRSLTTWKELAEKTNRELFYKAGVLWISDGSDLYTQQLPETLRRVGVKCIELTGVEIREKYPRLVFRDARRGVLEPASGVLMAREAVQALVQESIRLGVAYDDATVLAPWGARKPDAVRTSAGRSISAAAFIFACGPWLPKLFPALLEQRIRSTRQEVFFLGVPPGDPAFRIPEMPVWLHHTHPSRPYALPDLRHRGFKIAFDRHGPSFDPDSDSRVVGAESIRELRIYLNEHIPALANAPVVETRVCQYENTSSGDFLIDRHPDFENVWLVGGGSGHGFKHGPAVGEYVTGVLLGQVPAEPRFSVQEGQTIGARTVF